jgi:hypothetical protein
MPVSTDTVPAKTPNKQAAAFWQGMELRAALPDVTGPRAVYTQTDKQSVQSKAANYYEKLVSSSLSHG